MNTNVKMVKNNGAPISRLALYCFIVGASPPAAFLGFLAYMMAACVLTSPTDTLPTFLAVIALLGVPAVLLSWVALPFVVILCAASVTKIMKANGSLRGIPYAVAGTALCLASTAGSLFLAFLMRQ